MLDDALSVGWMPAVLAAQVRILSDGQGHEALRSVEIADLLHVAAETSLCVILVPLKVGRWFRHVGQRRDKNRFAAVILLISGLRSVIKANPASVALVRDPLYDAATCPYLSRRLPSHLLVINVAIVVERVVLGWAFE